MRVRLTDRTPEPERNAARRRWLWTALVALAAAGLVVTGGGRALSARPLLAGLHPALAQTGRAHVSHRLVIQRQGLPGIDTGLRPDTITRQPGVPEEPLRVADRPASTTPYIPGRLIVKFASQVPAATQAAILTAHGARFIVRPPSADFDVVTIPTSTNPETMADALNQRSDVAYAQADYREHAYMVPNDPLYSYQWNFKNIGMEQAWNIQPGASPSIVVAVLDTGMAYENVTIQFQGAAFQLGSQSYPALGTVDLNFAAAPDLASSGRFVDPYDFIWNDADPVDTDGHGTHVAGTIGQLTNNHIGTAGLAYNVKFMPVKVLDSQWDDIFGSPNQGTDDIVAEGIRYAADHGAQVINMSLGRTGPPAPAIQDAMQYAVSKGAFIAVAGGNDYENGNPTEVLPEIAAQIEGVVSVAATDRDSNRAPYSSTGSDIELAAPGGSFSNGYGAEGGILQQTLDLSQVDTYDLPPAQFGPPRFDAFAYYFFTGTSMATAHVSGLAALLMQQGITNPAAVEAAMEQFATHEGSPGRNDQFGFGLINPTATLEGLGLAR